MSDDFSKEFKLSLGLDAENCISQDSYVRASRLKDVSKFDVNEAE